MHDDYYKFWAQVHRFAQFCGWSLLCEYEVPCLDVTKD